MKIKLITRLLPLAGLLWGVLALSQTAMALGTDDTWDSPHTTDCSQCHALRGASYPNMVDKMCQSCHFVGGPVAAENVVQTHSSTTTDTDYGNWDLDCWSCHNPHTQGNASYGKLVKNDFNTITGPTIVKEINPAGGQDDGLGNLYYPPCTIGTWAGCTSSDGTIREITSDIVEFTGNTGFVDNDGLTEDDICQVCHASTGNYSSANPGTHNDYGPDTQPGGNCTSACHLHTAGFAAAGGSCTSCHAGALPSGAYRRQVTNTGGDFVRNRHHVTNGTTTEIVTEADCQVCHNQDNHQSNTDPQVVLNDGDIGAGTTYTYDGTGASVETFCLKCHDADGSLAYDPDGNSGDGYQPFSDGRNGTDINTGWAASSHATTAKSSLTTEACLTCHGGGDSTVTETVTDHNVHGSQNASMLSARVDTNLVSNVEENLCFSCHDGSYTGTPDIATSLSQVSRTSYHPVAATAGVHDPGIGDADDTGEVFATMARHVECQDCHNPHTADNSTATAPNVEGMLKGVRGVNANGTEVAAVSYQYEVCFKCHADNANVPAPAFPRVVVTKSLRAKFNDGLGTGDYATPNPSHHAVEGAGQSSNVPSLISPWTETSVLYCTDCHNDSAGTVSGPHGSDNPFLLKDTYYTGPVPYNKNNVSNYTTSNFALCWGCHEETNGSTGVLDDANGSFGKHKKHIQNFKSICSVCHDPHGIHVAQATTSDLENSNNNECVDWPGGVCPNNTRLINFRTDAMTSDGGNLLWEERGPSSGKDGSCYLNCHGKGHNDKNY